MSQTRMKLLLPDGATAAGKNIVFISYRHSDAEYAAVVIDLLLKETDLAIWYDDNLSAGEKFDEEIRDALDRSIAMIQIVTPTYYEVGSYTVEKEIPYAKSAGLVLAAVCISTSDRLAAEITKHAPDYSCALDNPDSIRVFCSALCSMDKEADMEERMLRSLKKRNRGYATPEDMFLLAQLYFQ